MTEPAERLLAAFDQAEGGASADGIPFARVPARLVAEALTLLRDELGYERLVDLTAVDSPEREERFELNYLVHSLRDGRWFRLKARTAGRAPSGVGVFPGLNFYERELYDLFGVDFDGHPNLTRLMLPDDWVGHPLRRDAPLVWEPVEFSPRSQEQYGD